MALFIKWVLQNPKASGAFLLTILSLLFKAYLQITGKSNQLDHWNDVASTIVDGLIGIAAVFGVIMGSIHTALGPAQSPADQTATIVAAIQGPPSPTAVAQVKVAAAEVEAQK